MTSDDINFSLNEYKAFSSVLKQNLKREKTEIWYTWFYISIHRTFTMQLSSESAL